MALGPPRSTRKDQSRVTEQTYLQVIGRQKAVILASVAVAATIGLLASLVLPDVYTATSKLIVSQQKDVQSFGSVQAAQVVARTYSDLLRSREIASEVSSRLPGLKPDSVDDAVSIEPIAETQLLKISADDESPTVAKSIADTYADTFVERSDEELAEVTSATVAVAEYAPLPEAPSRPRPALYTLIAALLGLVAGLGIAFLRNRRDTRLRTADELETAVGMPILARVPVFNPSDSPGKTRFAEAFNVLRTNLRFGVSGMSPRTIVVTSPGVGEGKSLIALRLARALAAANTKVLLVDGDVHKSSITRQFRLLGKGRENGLIECLLGQADVGDVTHGTGRDNLRVLPSAPSGLSLSALIEADRGGQAFQALAEQAEVVIADSPPLVQGADAAALSARADGVVLVIDLSTATEERVRGAVRGLEQVGAHLLGFVINRDSGAAPYDYYQAQAPRRRELSLLGPVRRPGAAQPSRRRGL